MSDYENAPSFDEETQFRFPQEELDDVRLVLQKNDLTPDQRRSRAARFGVLTVGLSCLASILLGYDISIMSAALVFIEDHFWWYPDLNAADRLKEEVVVSSLNLAALFGSFGAGFLADRFGRRKTVAVAAVIFIAGAVLMAAAVDFWMLCAGRVVTGLGVGTGLMISPLYVAELSSARMRGWVVSWSEIFINLGLLLGYVVGYGLAFVEDSNVNWRLMLGVAAVPAIVLLFGVLALYESPGYSLKCGKTLEAAIALDQSSLTLDETMERLRGVMEEQRREARFAHQNIFRKVLSAPSRVKKLLAVGLLVATLQQLTGIEAALYYSPKTFEAAGLNGTGEILGATIGVGGAKLAFTFVGAVGMDRIGRRPLLLASSAGLVGSLVMVGISFALSTSPIVAIVGQVLFVSSFGLGWGPICWVLISELFPLAVRGRLMGLATTCNRATSFLIAATFLSLSHAIGTAGIHFLFAGIACVALIFVAFFVPETKGIALEDVTTEGGVHMPYESCCTRGTEYV